MQHNQLLASLTLALLTFGTSPAFAATPAVPQAVVQYGDLNLTTAAGLARLQARVRGAAEKVCSPFESRVLGLHLQFEQCVNDAVARTRAQLPLLTAARS